MTAAQKATRPAKKSSLSKADRDYNEMLRSLRTNGGSIAPSR